MVFAVINIFIGLILFGFSFSVDRKNGNGALVNLILFLGLIFILMGLDDVLCINGARVAGLFAGRFTYIFMGAFSVNICAYLLTFPDFKKYRWITVFDILFYILAIWVILFAPNSFTSISISSNGAVIVTSGRILKGPLANSFGYSWLTVYNFFYRIIMPAFVSVMVLVRAEVCGSNLKRQNMIFNVLGVVLSWITFWYINKASLFIPSLSDFVALGYVPEVLMFAFSNRNDEVIDFRASFMAVVRFTILFIVPAAMIFGLFILLRPVADLNTLLFCGAWFLSAVLVFAIRYVVLNRFSSFEVFRNKRYAEEFEKDISSIDFELDASEITSEVFRIFNKYLRTSSMRIFIGEGQDSMRAVYSSIENDDVKLISLDQTLVDVLMNNKQQIVFRETAVKNAALVSIRTHIIELLDITKSDAMIVLSEGRQVVGVIFLGKKTSGNIYSEYDYNVFNKYYSNLFVVGYYVKNIMSEAVVGTVNREIRMSGQIITSIQENMDLIKSPKVDAGYLMTPTRNIGGEFIDMIRLTDTRHMFVIGALSGKGIAASMGMVILKSIVRTFLSETTDFKTLVVKINEFIRESLPKGTFFAGTFGILDFESDTMYYINCGIPALLVYTRAYNNVIEVQGEGHVLGFVKDISPYVKVKRMKLSEGDIVMIVTDGIIDTKSLRGDIFGKTRTQTTLMENSNYDATKMAKFTYDALVEFTSKEPENDVTILVMKYLGNKALSGAQGGGGISQVE